MHAQTRKVRKHINHFLDANSKQFHRYSSPLPSSRHFSTTTWPPTNLASVIGLTASTKLCFTERWKYCICSILPPVSGWKTSPTHQPFHSTVTCTLFRESHTPLTEVEVEAPTHYFISPLLPFSDSGGLVVPELPELPPLPLSSPVMGEMNLSNLPSSSPSSTSNRRPRAV